MSIALDGNGNSVRGVSYDETCLAHQRRLEKVFRRTMQFHGIEGAAAIAHILEVLEAHLDAEEHHRICKAYEKKADDMIKHLSSLE